MNLFNYTDIDEIESNAGDQWQYWRFRVDQEHRIGHYSPIYPLSNPSLKQLMTATKIIQLNFHEVQFLKLQEITPVYDATTDSSNNLNLGQSPTISVGTNPSLQEAILKHISNIIYRNYILFQLLHLFQ